MANEEWGPLAGLIGEWQGEGGLDSAYSHARHEVVETPYLEKVTMKPFGPVDNGSQHLYGLDYRSAMWRGNEENPFHTEVGYWLWDGATGEIMRCFVVPRGITTFAGGTATADAASFVLRADRGADLYNIGENTYLALTVGSNFAENRGNAVFSASYNDIGGILGSQRKYITDRWGFVANPLDTGPNDGVPSQVLRRDTRFTNLLNHQGSSFGLIDGSQLIFNNDSTIASAVRTATMWHRGG